MPQRSCTGKGGGSHARQDGDCTVKHSFSIRVATVDEHPSTNA